MADITNRVGGTGAANQFHDVALIQAMLRVIGSPKGHPYLAGHYNGVCGSQTISAIMEFQTDHRTANLPAAPPSSPFKLGVPALKQPSIPNPDSRAGGALKTPVLGAPASGFGPSFSLPSLMKDDFGVIKPGGATMDALNDLLPASHKGIRTAPGAHLVYWSGSAQASAASAAAIAAETRLNEDFRKKVANVVTLMFNKYELVLSLAGKIGGPRTFQEQFVQRRDKPNTTKAGPGESNHNFGQGVDLGFYPIKWMGLSGQPVDDDWWLNKLVPGHKLWSDELWGLRNEIAVDQLGLFPSGLEGDVYHLQRFSDGDDNVSMVNSLAKLLDTAGAMSWRHHGGGYECDLGFGGPWRHVGKSMEIWAETGPMHKDWIAHGKGVAVTAVSDGDLTAMRHALKADFEAAEAARDQWVAQPK
jgi:hypothetical protein